LPPDEVKERLIIKTGNDSKGNNKILPTRVLSRFFAAGYHHVKNKNQPILQH